jgi:hypothetical protein
MPDLLDHRDELFGELPDDCLDICEVDLDVLKDIVSYPFADKGSSAFVKDAKKQAGHLLRMSLAFRANTLNEIWIRTSVMRANTQKLARAGVPLQTRYKT